MHVQLNASILMNRKVSRFAKELGVNKREAIGYLSVLWLHVAHEAEDGRLEGYEVSDFDEILWTTESGCVLAAMLKCGLLVKTDVGYEVASWEEHTGDGLSIRAKRKEKRREYMKTYRAKSKGKDYPDHLANGEPNP